jgi:hypothetical protein
MDFDPINTTSPMDLGGSTNGQKLEKPPANLQEV